MTKKRGRKSAWIEKVQPRLSEIAAWCRDGLTENQICELLDVGVSTFNRIKIAKQELRETLKVSKNVADVEVENSLYKRALGYTYEEETTDYINNGEGKAVVKSKRVTKKTVLPDTTAQIFWLKNRKMREWREQKHIEHTGSIDSKIQNMTEEEVDKRIAELEAKLKKSKKKE